MIEQRNNPRINKLSHYYFDRYSNDLHIFKDVYKCNLINAFKKFNDLGVLEIIGCGATHGYFPILYVNEKTVRAQIAIGVQTYYQYFDKPLKAFGFPDMDTSQKLISILKNLIIQYVWI